MKVLISILFLLIANNSFAEDMRYYDVEIIVVENLSPDAKISESWPLQIGLVHPEKIVELGQPILSEWLPEEVDLTSSYLLLLPEEYQLIEQVKNISESKSHRIIFHTAWRQPGLDKNQSIPIYFKQEVLDPSDEIAEATQTEPTQEVVNLPFIENTIAPENELGPVQRSGIAPSILEGILRVTLSRYLHLEAEIIYKKSEPDVDFVEVESENPFAALYLEEQQAQMKSQGVVYLKQKRRRIRSNELHYIDHPILGVFVRITRYEKPEQTEELPSMQDVLNPDDPITPDTAIKSDSTVEPVNPVN